MCLLTTVNATAVGMGVKWLVLYMSGIVTFLQICYLLPYSA